MNEGCHALQGAGGGGKVPKEKSEKKYKIEKLNAAKTERLKSAHSAALQVCVWGGGGGGSFPLQCV